MPGSSGSARGGMRSGLLSGPRLPIPGPAAILQSGIAAACGSLNPGARLAAAVPAPEAWQAWLETMFPRHVRGGFSRRHEEFWSWVYGIEPEAAGAAAPRPFVGVWPRGGGKTTSAELAAANWGLRGKRKYVIYVRSTQDRSDDSVANIAALLESASVERHYPEHAGRALNKYGHSKGWKRNRVRTSGGFTVDALGMDTAQRGVKLDDQRPDAIILDDIDDKHDGPAATAKKVAIITTSILPAGSESPAVLAIQNLIIPHGVFSQLVDGRADFLGDRMVSGPFPAIEDMRYEFRYNNELGRRLAFITGGTPTWQGQDLEVCQRQILKWGPSAFMKEAQHDVHGQQVGIVLRYDEARHLENLPDDEARELVALGQAFASIDFGSWRFGFVLRAVDRKGRLRQIGELFIQRQNSDYKAKLIDAVCRYYGCTSALPIWGDCANQAEIADLNAAFERLARDRENTAAKTMGGYEFNYPNRDRHPFTVTPILQKSKIKDAGIERMNDLLDRDAMLYRRNVMRHMQLAVEDILGDDAPDIRGWRLGFSASSAGTPMQGSRLQWEAGKWAYPPPVEGHAQAQEPDDHTADGADLTDADRYGVMSFWGEPEQEPPPAAHAFDAAVLAAEAEYTQYDRPEIAATYRPPRRRR